MLAANEGESQIAVFLIRAFAAILILATGLSILESNEWWIRIWDFPRVQILGLLIVAGIAAIWRDKAKGKWVAAFCVIAGCWQLYRIYPYTVLATQELAFAEDLAMADDRCFSVLSLNVLQSNHDYSRTVRLIDREKPDIMLLMETDAAWTGALEPVLKRYPNVMKRPLDNTYGLIFATRLPMEDASVEMIADERTPSISARVTAGTPFRVIGLHPRPPLPGQDTEARDAEIAVAARRAAREKMPVLALGDFNDVAWSHTSQLFKRIGGYLDPRIGRGTFATFPADAPLFGWPLDHLFVTREFEVRSLQVLEHVGSDHLPVHARLCLAGSRSDNPAAEPVTGEDLEDVEEVLDEYLDDRDESDRGGAY